MNPNLLARLNDEYPASRHNTAWVLDESGVPTRRVGGNIGDEATPPALTEVPARNRHEYRAPSRSF